ncbi:MAG: SirB2 family protein [Gammaproteobacteria bacterium]|nr:SirB2 family protein [Gammaproteobacteria bacterium]
MTAYNLLKAGHIACVVVSGSLFVLRYVLHNIHPQRPLPASLKVLPHINDTALLGCAIGMLVIAGLNPFAVSWLLAKIIALFVYIALGAMCMRATPASRGQAASFAAAMIAFGYIVLVAISKAVLPV